MICPSITMWRTLALTLKSNAPNLSGNAQISLGTPWGRILFWSALLRELLYRSTHASSSFWSHGINSQWKTRLSKVQFNIWDLWLIQDNLDSHINMSIHIIPILSHSFLKYILKPRCKTTTQLWPCNLWLQIFLLTIQRCWIVPARPGSCHCRNTLCTFAIP